MRSNKLDTRNRAHTIAVSALAALWLSACGGGGGGDPVVGPAPAPAPVAGSPTPPAPTVTAISVTTDTVALANRSHEVNAAGTAGVNITLPAAPNAGDTVRVTGISASPWTLVPNAGQTIVTTAVTGNVAPGASWTASSLAPVPWHWVSSNATGEVVVAGHIPGDLYVSTDGGATWTPVAGLPAQNWISIDMSASGDRIVAVGYAGNMYISNDRGTTWTQVADPSPTIDFSNVLFESVTVSANGEFIAANVMNGGIFVSANGGQTWARATLAGGAPLDSRWRGIDSSADGTFLVAVSQDALVYTSSDAGLTWTLEPIVVDGAAVTEGWYRVAVSGNGRVIAIAANSYGGGPGTALYISRDAGGSWARAGTMAGDFTSIDMSADGSVIGVTLSETNGNTGGVYLSTDTGATFTSLAPGADTLWRAITLSEDGNKMTVVAGAFDRGPGGMYTSLGNRTSYGSRGALVGGQNQTVDVEYVGNGRFRVTNATGGAFTIR